MKNQDWSIEKAKLHYRIGSWGKQHYTINSKGNLAAKIENYEIDLYELSHQIQKSDIRFPVLVRFPQVLQKSLSDLCCAFHSAIQSNNYTEKYVAAYPIKVNQQSAVVQHYHDQQEWAVAFEVGSKAELIACLGIGDKKLTIICNGYKDEMYIRIALMGYMLGHEIIIVIESLVEFQHVLKHSLELKVQPKLGMRIRLSAIAKGNWQNTGGKHSKFGLTSSEVLALVQQLRENNVLPWVKMLHFHMGSQIPLLKDIQSGMQEGMHYYAELVKQGLSLEMLNVGGGLAVDYEGSNSESYFSMNYTLSDYANTIIGVIADECKRHSLQQPIVVSESGRAMAAYHAVLITDVIDIEEPHAQIKNETTHVVKQSNSPSLSALIKYINKINAKPIDKDSLVSGTKKFQELKSIIEHIEQDFSQGKLSLTEKAESETLVSLGFEKMMENAGALSEQDRECIEDAFINKYFCNFSLFQSTPDVWGLKQVFPIMPLHRLDELPTKKARIYDLTCDSDGRIDHYVEAASIQSYLSLHECRKHHEYVIGVFLVGAYQEILGDLHNLFGDTNALNVVINIDGSYQICDEEPGDTVEEILSYLHMDTVRMRKVWIERLSSNKVAEHESRLVLSELEASLRANSYLS